MVLAVLLDPDPGCNLASVESRTIPTTFVLIVERM